MTHRLPASLLLTCALMAGPQGVARADDEPQVLVVQLSGDTTGPLADAPARLTRVLEGVVRASSPKVTVAPREDVLSLAGCPDTGDDCMRQAAGMFEVQRVVVGEVRPAGDGVDVELRVIEAEGAPRRRVIHLRGASGEAVASQFEPQAAAFWRGEDAPASPASEAAPAAPAATTATTAVVEAPAEGGGFSAGRVRPYAWAVAGAGIGMLAVGGLLLVSASGVQSDIDDAPTDTAADLEALEALEDRGRRRARWGSALTVVGAATAAVGAVLVFRQGRSAPDQEGDVALTPSVSTGSIGVALTVTTP